MARFRLLQLAFLALPFIAPAQAETNVAGIEITLIEPDDAYPADDFPLMEESTAEPSEPTQQNANLWQRIKDGYAMPDLQSPYTAKHESWYASRPDYVNRMVGRGQKYLYHIVQEVQKRGMPTEIALLPMIESAFNPQAYSVSHASGIWQFIPSTGKNFGLKQDWWVDKRRDITAATDAALTYLQKLHVMFGSWDLALAAYNAGEGTVMRAIERNRKKGLPTDYQSLDLPAETRNYVPKLQAVKNIVTHPEAYGLKIQPIANKPYFSRVTISDQIDGQLAAKLAEISWEEFSALNPEFKRPVLATGDGGSHEILLPLGADETFRTNLALYDKPLVSWQTYQAKPGEKQTTIARKFGISLSELRAINDLPAHATLKTRRQLLVPKTSVDVQEALLVAALEPDTFAVENAPFLDYRVKAGDTLGAIAQRHGTSVKKLMAANHLRSTTLKPGQKLTIATVTAIVADLKPRKNNNASDIRYTVRRGDTLHSIARKFDVAANDIKKWNKLSSNMIMPGDKLTILKPESA